MKQDLLELDFSEQQVDTKTVKIKQSECTFENKGQLKEELKD